MNDLLTLQPPEDLGSNPAETRAIDCQIQVHNTTNQLWDTCICVPAIYTY